MSRPEARKNAQITQSGALTFPIDLGREEEATQHYLLITSRRVNLLKGFNGTALENPLSIALYLPAGALKHNYESRYETFEGMEAAQTATAVALNKARAEAGTTGFNNQSTLLDTLVKAAGDQNVIADITSDLAASTAQVAAAKSDIAQAALIGAGAAVNPYLSLMYKGPGAMRTFNLNYDFIARNQAESVMIARICEGLRQRMLPAKFNTQIHSYFLQVPHHFKLEVYVKGGGSRRSSQATESKSRRLFKIIDTVITTMNVDYAGSGVPVFFKDTGEPFNVKLDLSFQETRVLTKNVFESGEGVHVDGAYVTQQDIDRFGLDQGPGENFSRRHAETGFQRDPNSP